MGIQSEQQVRQAGIGSVATADEIQDSGSPCQLLLGDDDSQAGQTSSGNFIPCLPEDVWCHIHSLLPMDVAARAACLSRTFLRSWRCYPKLILSSRTLNANNGSLRQRIDSILRNHSGIGLKILRLDLRKEHSCLPYIERWLKVALAQGVEELNLRPPLYYEKYNFSSSVLSERIINSIRSLQLEYCVFRPTAELGPFRSITILSLRSVCITGYELECLLSNSLALERLYLTFCNEIISLKIPPVLQQLSYLLVCGCSHLQIIENKAPNIFSFTLYGDVPILSLGKASQMMKVFGLCKANAICYARAKLPSIMLNLETLSLRSIREVDTPMLPTKFENLKHLVIQITSLTLFPSYDYFSLVSFLDASPFLETWRLEVPRPDMRHELVGSSHLRQLPERRHDHLKTVELVGFNSTKSLVELACCIVKSAVSLERLTFDTFRGYGRSPCCRDDLGMSNSRFMVQEVSRAVAAIRRYIEDNVLPTTKPTVLEACTRCHANAYDDA